MRDLSKELTVFVITTSGEVNYKDCIAALEIQTVKFKTDIIKDYFPLSRAFQEMLNRCKTKYYVEVDSDMILNPDAIERLYNKVIRLSDKHPYTCFPLLDKHLDLKLFGIKIYKYEIFKNYPYNLEHPSCEVEQLDRMEKDGFVIEDNNVMVQESVVGEHSPKWTEETIFERYYNLMEKFKLFRYIWLEDLPKKLVDIFRKNPNTLNFYAVAGMLSSIYSDETLEEEKDTRRKRKDYKRLDSFLERPKLATIYMTSGCNFKCSFCYRQHHNIEQAPDMEIRLANHLLTKFPSIEGICICGFGEPLMSPYLVPVLKVLKSANKYVGLITNGSLLAEKLDSLIGWFSPDYISVSLNSHCKELHEKISGTKTFDLVLAGIKKLVQSKIPCYVSSVVTTKNIAYVPELVKLVKSLGVKTLNLHNLLPHFDEKQDKEFWELVLTEKHKPLIDKIKQLPEADIIKKYPTLIDKEGGKQTCTFPWAMIGTNGKGSISVCNSVFPCSEEKFGNINDFALWNSKKLEKFRTDFMDKKIEACKRCFRNWEQLEDG